MKLFSDVGKLDDDAASLHMSFKHASKSVPSQQWTEGLPSPTVSSQQKEKSPSSDLHQHYIEDNGDLVHIEIRVFLASF